MDNMIEKGFYKHYKGGLYEVVGTSIHTETEDVLVLYKDKNGNFWSSPIDVFIEVGNFIPTLRVQIPRFEKVMIPIIKTDFGYIGEDNLRSMLSGISVTTIENARYYDDDSEIDKILNKHTPINARIELTHRRR